VEKQAARAGPAPRVYAHNRVTPLIGGEAYFQALAGALARVGAGETPADNRGHFLYVSGWLLNLADPQLPFCLPGPDGPISLLELLKAKSRAGVDVRILAWVSWSLGMFGRFDVRYENMANIETDLALRREPGLKVVLVTGDFQPPGPPLPEGMPVALLDGLLPGLGAAETGRIAVLQRSGFVHAKTTLVDDHWALIGSANLARRSHFTDVEHAVAVVDPDEQLLQAYRAALWDRHFELVERARRMPPDLDQALGRWDPDWAPNPAGDRPAARFTRLPLERLARPQIDPCWYVLIDFAVALGCC
jgi:phosphatidylserine/phosphatidylglycerophosphate/cardiolipin synthase-like enzyme